ncbi:hypothetical protein FOL47_000544 [Perkinsus chesapeaki]|uniref:Group 1 truncated hemoglobin n=1 Tax=Perkinsus chesapeaki TaxID=330153 RepID=A0A7J6N113_PERCH|nr:hypothetical protein FOL47_000544 [Perkinsus chesapeaki]
MTDKCLFDRMGGKATVDAVVEQSYDKQVVDPKVGHYFEGKDMSTLKAHQKDFLSYAFGKPGHEYTGRSMKEVHKGLNIKDDDFNAYANNMNNTLKELSVPSGEAAEAMQFIEGQRKNIVGQ